MIYLAGYKMTSKCSLMYVLGYAWFLAGEKMTSKSCSDSQRSLVTSDVVSDK